jgi:hypothetical protein
MFPVAAAAALAWLLLFIVLLTVPPGRRRVSAQRTRTVPAGDAPPAVVSLLAGEFGRCGFEATLVDLPPGAGSG